MKLCDLLDLDELELEVEAGYVRVQTHPSLPHLRICNYAEKAQFEKRWNEITLACRGLIYDSSDLTVLARPWGKFFNYGEHPDGSLDLDAPVEVTDKMDGSLGILYFVDGAPAIATRGSFASDQAQHATDLYLRRYHGTWFPDTNLTYLFEIVFPANRIVLDYGDLDDLVLLGAVEVDSGRALGPGDLSEWAGPRTCTYPARTLREALELPPRPNAEGLVVRYPNSNLLVKIKQDDYVVLHRIITGLNERAVWERLGAGETIGSICEQIPDEFHTWVVEVALRLFAQKAAVEAAAMADYTDICCSVSFTDRKSFAMAAAKSPHRALLFMMLDGKDTSAAIWKSLKPGAGNYARPAAEVAA